jgi:hypothetical protein
MAEDTDFAALYRELGLDPGCTFADLRSAYRRRVARLHPDQGGDAQDTGRLQQLTRLYRAAIDFHRAHDRLPGAASAGPHRAAESVAAVVNTPAASADEAEDGTIASTPLSATGRGRQTAGFARSAKPGYGEGMGTETSAAGFGKLPRYFVAAAVLCIAALGWRVVGGEAGVPSVDTEAAGAVSLRTSDLGKVAHLAPGMGKDIVQQIQGEPIARHDVRWDYGPSWVEFRCGKVVDWYSSPLRPLHATSARAPASLAAGDDRDSACAP